MDSSSPHTIRTPEQSTVSEGLEPLQVTIDDDVDEACIPPIAIATITMGEGEHERESSDPMRMDCNHPSTTVTANKQTLPTTTIASAARTEKWEKYDLRYDPLPYRIAESATTVTQQQLPQQQQQQQHQHQAFRPSSFVQQQRKEEGYNPSPQGGKAMIRRRPSLEQNLYCESFPQQHHQFQTTQDKQQEYRHLPTENTLVNNRPTQSQWQRQSQLESVPPYNAPLLIEPAPVWLPANANTNSNTGMNSTNHLDTKTREAQGQSSSDLPIRNDDDSNPIPIRRPLRFHPVQQPLQTFGQPKQKPHQELQLLGQSSGLHTSKHPQQQGATPIGALPTRRGHGPPQGNNDERRDRMCMESFQGRPFYPPQQNMPQQTNPPPQQQELPTSTNRNFFDLPDQQFQLPQQLHHGRAEKVLSPPNLPPMPPRGTPPFPASYDNDRFAEPKTLLRVKLEREINSNDNNKKRKWPWNRQSLRGMGCTEASFTSPKRDKNSDTSSPASNLLWSRERVTATVARQPTFKPRQHTGGGDTYIRRLHVMLEEAQREGFDHIVSWQAHGRAFKIHSLEEFTERILIKYFHTEKISSFRRWLSAWGFVKHNEGADRGAFYHRFFVRGVVLSLVDKMTREQMLRSMEGWLAPGEAPNLIGGDADNTGTGTPTTQSEGGSNSSSDLNGREIDADDEATEPSKVQDRKIEPITTGTLEGGNEIIIGEDKNNTKNNHTGPSVEVDPSMLLTANPKRLRGRLLEDVRRMLQDAIENNFSDIVGWLNGGKAFKIHNPDAFQEEVCRTYFKASKVSSFSDSLRKWGFCRLSQASGYERGAYYHRLFQEGKPQLCRHYSRTQMVKAMSEFREEQKRQKEISWSYFPHHRGEQETTVVPQPQPQSQEYMISYIDLPNVNTDNTIANCAHNVSGSSNNDIDMDSNMDHVYGDNYVMDPCYQILPPGTMDTAALPSDGKNQDPRTSTELQAPSPVPRMKSLNRKMGFKGVSYIIRVDLMLEDVERRGQHDIVSWMSHGRAFKIHDEKDFESKILPRYFQSSRNLSFNRWLNHWGFLRIHVGRDRRCWYHRLFVRGVTELVKDFSRNEFADAMADWRASGKEPDFYCAGRGDELSELPPSSVVPKTNSSEDKALHEKSTTGHSHKRGELPSTTNAGGEEEAPPKLQSPQNPRHLRGTMVENLREMLVVVRDEGKTDIVSWLAHGKAFKIHKPKKFEEAIMHRFFRASKYRYFADVLRSWGFVIFKNGRDKGAFYHKYFLKNEPKLPWHLSKAQMKASMGNWSTYGIVPNFYDADRSSTPIDPKTTPKDDTSLVPMEPTQMEQEPNPGPKTSTRLPIGNTPSAMTAPII